MAFIQRIPIALALDFLGKRKLFMAFSAALMVASVALFVTAGLNLGIDFRGGTLIEARFHQAANLSELRSGLGNLGLGQVTLQEFGEETDVLINLQRQEGDEAAQIKAIEAIKTFLGDAVAEYRRTEFVGPTVGGELRQAGFLATLLALLGIGFYVWFRFEWQFSAAALIALSHDVIATIGFYCLTQIEFNLATLAAVLTIAGYSINDTVVIFDRVRENLRKYKKLPLPELLNKSLNQTLTRTLLTSITTLLALFALFFFGGQVIRGFTAGLIWGVAIGTYSSIGLAVPLMLYMNLRGTLGGAKAGGAKAGGAKAEIEDQSETETGEVTPAG
jgi:preprotein translocase SecF subunit